MSVYSQIASAERMAAQRAQQDMQMMKMQMEQSAKDQQHFSEEMDKQRTANAKERKDMMEMMREQNKEHTAGMKEMMDKFSDGSDQADITKGGTPPKLDTKDIKPQPTHQPSNVSYA